MRLHVSRTELPRHSLSEYVDNKYLRKHDHSTNRQFTRELTRIKPQGVSLGGRLLKEGEDYGRDFVVTDED